MKRKLVTEKPLPRMSALNTATKREVKKALSLLEQLEELRELYKELDDITTILQKLHFTGVKVKPGIDFILKDNFAQSNIVFRSAGVKRYKLFIRKGKAHAK